MITESSLISTGVAASAYMIEGIIQDSRAKQRREAEQAEGEERENVANDQPSVTLKRSATTLTISALPSLSLVTQDARFNHTMDKYHQEYIQVEAQSYVDSMSDEDLELALEQVGLLEKDMTVDTEKTR